MIYNLFLLSGRIIRRMITRRLSLKLREFAKIIRANLLTPQSCFSRYCVKTEEPCLKRDHIKSYLCVNDRD